MVVALFAPNGVKIIEVDEEEENGTEELKFVTEAAGVYELQVRAFNHKSLPGHYEVALIESRLATTQDKIRLAAEQSVKEGLKFWEKENEESLRQALLQYQKALKLFQQLGDKNEETRVLHNIGRIYDEMDDSQNAVIFFTRALAVERNGGDISLEPYSLFKIGTIYRVTGDYQEALRFLNEARTLGKKLNDRKVEALTLNTLGSVYHDIGETQKALDCFKQALDLLRAQNNSREMASALHNIGRVYEGLGELRNALEFFDQSLKIKQSIDDRPGQAFTLFKIGEIYYILDESQRAVEFYNRALTITQETGQRRLKSFLLSALSEIYEDLGDTQKEFDLLNQALKLQRELGYRLDEAQTLSSLGWHYYRSDEVEKALDFFHQSLVLHFKTGDKDGEAGALYGIALIEMSRNNLASARARMERALSLIEDLRVKVISPDQRSSFFAHNKHYYDSYIELLMRLHKQNPKAGYDALALQASERARARSLLELLSEAHIEIKQGVDPELLQREHDLQQQLNAKARRQMEVLGDRHTEQQADTLAKEIAQLTVEYQLVQAKIKQVSPRYAALTQPQPLTLKEIQTQVLDPGTLLLEYSLGADRTFLWAVTQTEIKSYELPKRKEIEDNARQFYDSISKGPQQTGGAVATSRDIGGELLAEAGEKASQMSTKLGRMLLAPVAPLLGKKRLLIIADGALQYIPFAALHAPVNNANTTSPLIIEHEIVTLPSASMLAVLRRESGGRKPAPKMLAVLADPVFERTDERLKDRVADDGARDLAVELSNSVRETGAELRIRRLPATQREAEEIAKLVPPEQSMVAVNFAANRATATSAALGLYRFVHFATHGFLNSEHPELSGLVLSLYDEQGRPQEGFLRAHEIFNMKLSADMAVLSACQTGLGKEVKGEGLVGLTRGFMYAGAQRVVVSLWSVSDEATAELMGRFYRGLLVDKLRPAQALQAAQVSILKEKKYSSPFYWGAFTLQGEWR